MEVAVNAASSRAVAAVSAESRRVVVRPSEACDDSEPSVLSVSAGCLEGSALASSVLTSGEFSSFSLSAAIWVSRFEAALAPEAAFFYSRAAKFYVVVAALAVLALLQLSMTLPAMVEAAEMSSGYMARRA